MKRSRLKYCCLALILAVILGSVYFYICCRDSQNVFFASSYGDETVVIDAGHGGEDGGAVSVSGAVESKINLDIALRLDELFGLLGVRSVLLRDSDVSLHDSTAQTLREKKVSDLKNRVSMVDSYDNPVLISIHQNTYTNSKYHGAQVFYANGELSLPFAQITQKTLKDVLDPSNSRQPTSVPESVYLMNHIACKAILVECGFLSNPQEDALLQTNGYQTKVALALAGAYVKYQTNLEGETLHAS